MPKAGVLIYEIRADTSKLKSDLDKAFKQPAGQTMDRMKGNSSPLKSLLPIGGALAGSAIIVSLLTSINQSIEKQLKKIEESSAAFKSSKEIFEKSFNLALKPMGDIMSIFLKPYLQLQMLRLREGLKQAGGVLRQLKSGQITEETAFEEINKIFRDMIVDLSFIQRDAAKLIKPMAANIDGFITGLNTNLVEFLTGVGGWVANFIDGLFRSNIEKIPLTLVEFITREATKNPELLNQLPKRISDAYLEATKDKMSKIVLPDILISPGSGSQIINKIISGVDSQISSGILGITTAFTETDRAAIALDESLSMNIWNIVELINPSLQSRQNTSRKNIRPDLMSML